MSKYSNLITMDKHSISIPPFIMFTGSYKEIEEFVKKTNSKYYAVRSSANVEDSLLNSCAGLFRTFLCVKEDALYETINKCLFQNTYEIKEYLKKRQTDICNIQMEVIVQEMIDTDVSGVLFTKDPTNSGDYAIVEAAYGLCEGIVSGFVTGDKVVCDLNQEKLIQYKVNYQDKMKVPSNRGVITTHVPYIDRCKIKLVENQLILLLHYANRIKDLLGYECDIEWGIKGNDIYIFQARSITTNDN